MKNINKLLQKKNLTPKERVKLLAYNAINKERTGKVLLTEAEEKAIGEAWIPQNNQEVIEYNKYSKAWRTWGRAELDVQTCYFRGREAFENLKMILIEVMRYPRILEINDALTHLKTLCIEKDEEAREILHKNIKNIETAINSIYPKTTTNIPDHFSQNKLFIDGKESFLEEYGRLLAFYEINKKLSKIFDIDLTDNNFKYLAQLNKDAMLFNKYLITALDGIGVKDESLIINTDDIKPVDDISCCYIKELSIELGNNF